MATALGLDTNLPAVQAADASYRETISKSIQDLGKRVSEVLKQQQTNRQIQGMARDFGMLNINSPDFPVDMMTVASQYPLAAQSPTGKNGMDLLGLAWSRQQTAAARKTGGSSASRVSGKYQDIDTGKIHILGTDQQWNEEPPVGANLKTLGSFAPENLDQRKDEFQFRKDLQEENQLLKEKSAAEKKEKADRDLRKKALDARFGNEIKTLESEEKQNDAGLRDLSKQSRKLESEGELPGIKVWEQGGKWYKSNVNAIKTGEGRLDLKQYATEITPEDAQIIQSRKGYYDALPKLIETAESTKIGIKSELDKKRREWELQTQVLMGQAPEFNEVPLDEPLSSQTQQVPVRQKRYNPATRSIE